MPKRLLVAGALALAILPGCRRAHRPHVPPAYTEVQLRSDVARATRELEAVRGVRFGAPVQARLAPAEDYARRIRRHWADAVRTNAVLWQPLGFADGAATSDRVADRIVDDTRALAFYDAAQHTLWLRAPAPGFDAAAEPTVIEALEQARLDQAKQLPPFPGADVDPALARWSLAQGDAAATAIAYFARHAAGAAGASAATADPVQAIARGAAAWTALPADDQLRATGFPAELAAAPLLVRDELVRGRVAGLALAAALVRAGGFALVDRALAAPPATMAQVFDPARYLAGDGPATFVPPTAPRGTLTLAAGRLGMIGVSAFFDRCLESDEAAALARGWAGDELTLFRAGDKSTVAWAIAWRDEAAAMAATDELTTRMTCTSPNMVRFEIDVLRHGATVALVTKSPPDELGKLIDQLSRSARPPAPPKPPLGPVTPPPAAP